MEKINKKQLITLLISSFAVLLALVSIVKNNIQSNQKTQEISNETNEKVSVTFDYSNDSNSTIVTLSKNETIEKPETPTREGYTFLDWYLNDDIYDFNLPVEENITIIAKWEPTIDINETNSTTN